MKKIVLSFVLTLVCSIIVAQETSLKFLGIPVDGTKKEFFEQLKKKGFEVTEYEGNMFAEGEFNGKNSIITVRTVNRMIDRVVVQWGEYMSEGQIKIAYNNLVRQFEKNDKYVSEDEQYLPEDEDLGYEMTVHDKQYQASFYLSEEVEALTEKAIEFMKANPEYESMDESELRKFVVDMMEKGLNSVVWFTLDQRIDEYKIIMFYDNMKNSASGDEL